MIYTLIKPKYIILARILLKPHYSIDLLHNSSLALVTPSVEVNELVLLQEMQCRLKKILLKVNDLL